MKFIKYLISVCCTLALFDSPAQNLVSNPGFEILSSGLNGAGQINIATDWSAPLGSSATPDLFNASFVGPPVTICDNVGVPNNTGGTAAGCDGTGSINI